MEPDSYPTQSFAILAVPISLGAKIMEIGEKILGRLKPLGKFAELLGKNFAPKVSISIANDLTWHLGDQRLPSGLKGGLTALIDTGSDVTTIDSPFVELLHLQQIGEVTSSFTGITRKTPVYHVQLVFPKQKFVVDGSVQAVALRGTGNYHDVILGLD